MANMLEMMSKITVMQSELVEFRNVERHIEYRCDEDWVPTLRVVNEQIIGRYQEMVRDKMNAFESQYGDKKRPNLSEFDRELKSMLFFMLWILDTCEELDEAARNRLDEFVRDKLIVVNDDEVSI